MIRSENHDAGRAAAQPGEIGCERVFPAQFFAAVIRPESVRAPVTKAVGGVGMEDSDPAAKP